MSDHTEIVRALRTVIDVEQQRRENYNDTANAVYDVASRLYQPASHADIDVIDRRGARGAIDWIAKGPKVYLPHTTTGGPYIPVVGMYIDLRDDRQPTLRFHTVFLVANNRAPVPTSTEELHGVGLRYETPEGVSGLHAFYHAQLFTHLVKNDVNSRVPNCPEWLPVKQPALPLSVTSPIGLVAALLVSIYGIAEAQRDFDWLIGHMAPPPKASAAVKSVESARPNKKTTNQQSKPGGRKGRF